MFSRILKTALAFSVLFAFAVALLSCSDKGSAGSGSATSASGGNSALTASPASPAPSNTGVPSVSMVKGLDARKALALADKWGRNEKRVTSFVDTKNVSFEFSDGKKISVPLPDSEMVVAIAPYLTYTHECEIHYMSGCQAELSNVPVKVYGKSKDGKVVVDETVMTLDNGFIELWLPRNLEIALTVEAMGKKSTGTITTYNNSNTCITTMKLS